MFDLSVPWWEPLLRGLLVYVALFVMLRVTGKRAIGQFTPFDLLVMLLLSEAVSNSLTGGEQSVTGGILVAATLVVLNAVVSVATAVSPRVEKLTEGTPVLVGRDGQIFREVLKRERVGIGELEQALREADCELSEMRCAFLETDGNFSILKKKG